MDGVPTRSPLGLATPLRSLPLKTASQQSVTRPNVKAPFDWLTWTRTHHLPHQVTHASSFIYRQTSLSPHSKQMQGTSWYGKKWHATLDCSFLTYCMTLCVCVCVCVCACVCVCVCMVCTSTDYEYDTFVTYNVKHSYQCHVCNCWFATNIWYSFVDMFITYSCAIYHMPCSNFVLFIATKQEANYIFRTSL
jgi:hypothetical protein